MKKSPYYRGASSFDPRNFVNSASFDNKDDEIRKRFIDLISFDLRDIFIHRDVIVFTWINDYDSSLLFRILSNFS